MDERAFWVEIRRALLIVVRAIEARYGLRKHEEPRRASDAHLATRSRP